MKIIPVVRKARLKDIDEDLENLNYWLSRPVHERLAAVTRSIGLSLKPGERMDKTVVTQRRFR